MMRYQIIFFIISISLLLVTSEKSQYNNYQNQAVVTIVNDNTVISKTCLVTSVPNDFPNSKTEENMKFYNLLYAENFDLCNITGLSLKGYESVVITPSHRCGMIQQKANARSLNIKILLYITKQQVALPYLQSELGIGPAVVLMPAGVFISKRDKLNNSKIGIFVSATKENISRISEYVIFSLVMITVLMTVGITIGLTYEILEGEEHTETPNNGQFTTLQSTGSTEQPKTGQIKYIAIILPIFMIGMLLLMYFFFFIMVWVIIMAFYFISAFCFAMLIMLFVKRYNCEPNLKRPCNRCGFLNFDYRNLALLIIGLVISTVWIISRKSTLGLVLNNIMGVYICISVAISLGATFVIGRNFKVLLGILVIFVVIDAVMVYVPIGNTKPDVSQQIALFSAHNEMVRTKRSDGSIMESVATAMGGTSSEEIPIRFKIPKIPYAGHNSSTEACQIISLEYSMIGFGDLIIPGAFIVYILIFAVIGKSNLLLYALLTFFGYAIGLVCTYVAVVLSKKGQPALVFLLPCTVIPTLLAALIRKEFMSLWYSNWLPQRLDNTSDAVNQSADDNL